MLNIFLSESQKRKQRSEKLLTKLGSEYLPSLPVIETEEEMQLRSSFEIGRRIICLLCVAAVSDGVDRLEIIDWLKKEKIYKHLSNDERQFLIKKNPDKNELIKFSWQSECLWLLLWSVNKVKRDLPIEECDINMIIDVVPGFGESISDFINSLKIKNKKEILDLSDFLYRAHWTTRQFSLDNKTNIGVLNPGVVQEWHYAINWLTCYNEIDDWDEITTDT